MLGYDNDEGLKRWKIMRKCRGDLRVAGDRYNGALDDGKHCSETLPEEHLISEVFPEGELISEVFPEGELIIEALPEEQLI